MEQLKSKKNQASDKIGQMMKKSKIGLFIAFIGTFSFWDLVWFPLALWTAYKIGSGRE